MTWPEAKQDRKNTLTSPFSLPPGATGRSYPEASLKGALSFPAMENRAKGRYGMDMGDNT